MSVGETRNYLMQVINWPLGISSFLCCTFFYLCFSRLCCLERVMFVALKVPVSLGCVVRNCFCVSCLWLLIFLWMGV